MTVSSTGFHPGNIGTICEFRAFCKPRASSNAFWVKHHPIQLRRISSPTTSLGLVQDNRIATFPFPLPGAAARFGLKLIRRIHGPTSHVNLLVEDSNKCPMSQLIAQEEGRSFTLVDESIFWQESLDCFPNIQ